MCDTLDGRPRIAGLGCLTEETLRLQTIQNLDAMLGGFQAHLDQIPDIPRFVQEFCTHGWRLKTYFQKTEEQRSRGDNYALIQPIMLLISHLTCEPSCWIVRTNLLVKEVQVR